MLILALLAASSQLLLAHSWITPEFPEEPSDSEILAHNNLAEAEEKHLYAYLLEDLSSVGYWLPFVTADEESRICAEYTRRLENRETTAQEYWKSITQQLTDNRLKDRRRIVDAVIRKIGHNGTGESIPRLLYIADRVERPWVAWKLLASVQQLLARVDPTTLHNHVVGDIRLDLVAPLFRDLEDETAARWAWMLWEKRVRTVFPSSIRLQTRVWLARSFASLKPEVAVEVFRHGLNSHDAAIRTTTEMFLRSGLGDSIAYETDYKDLLSEFLQRKWSTGHPRWAVLPRPLEQPLPRKQYGGRLGRTDLVWLDEQAVILSEKKDVWPLVYKILPNGLFYSRLGGSRPPVFALTSEMGEVTSRFPRFSSYSPLIASHGGLWTITSWSHATEFAPDGSVLWQCPLSQSNVSGYSAIAPLRKGKIVLLGSNLIECRDRRGDLVWKCKISGASGTRSIYPISPKKFLLTCQTSVGWVTTKGAKGEYTPLVTGLKSANSVRYHPDSHWVILDGGTQEAVIFDPSSQRVSGRFDLDDGGEKARSQFGTDPRYYPE